MNIYGQRDSRWSSHPLGWGPKDGTIGEYGCLNTCFAMIALDSGKLFNPGSLDEYFTSKKIFVQDLTGTYDLLPDNALDVAFPGGFQTRHVNGFDAAGIAAAVKSPDTYVILFISTASVPTHFVIAWSADAKYIADPWTGKVGTLAGYGGPSAVHKTTYVKKLPAVAPAPVPAPIPVPAPKPVPVPTPPVVVKPPVVPPVVPAPLPTPVPPSLPKPDYSLQGLLVYIINLFLKVMGQR